MATSALYGSRSDDRLAGERRNAAFDVTSLAVILAGGKTALDHKETVIRIAQDDPVLVELQQSTHLVQDRRQAIRNVLMLIHHVKRLEHQGAISRAQANTLLFDCGLSTGGLDLHAGVFVPSLRSMTTKEQASEWVPKAESMQWLGCYAQTELAHGSNVRGLQTTATFIPEDDEFEINTPSAGASKWWPGGLGVLSTHCLLYARLVIGGKDHGIHNFLVPVRSLDDHSPLPGVTIGDIGPKFGVNSNDNGFVHFTGVRIPRFNLLAKFAEVTRDGSYVKRKGSGGAGVYSSMTQVRGAIASRAFSPLAAAVTIAVRYACVRRQEPGKGPADERPILDYSSVQWRLLPEVATAYALRFMGFALHNEIEDLNRQIAKNPQSTAAAASALHATTCALKSCCTALAADGMEECRRACGGHGFHNASGLPKLYADYFQHFTPEGDNWLLTQQTSSIVLRTLQALDAGQDLPMTQSFAYLREGNQRLQQRCQAEAVETLVADVGRLADGLEHRAVWLWRELLARQLSISSGQGSGKKEEMKSATLVEQFKAAQAHGVAVVMRYFAKAVEDIDERGDWPSAVVLRQLAALFAVVHTEKARGDLLCSGWLTVAQAKLLLPAAQHLCAKLRGQAVPLVDAFGKSDFELNSAIGAWDGRYEERLVEFARREPLNAVWNSGGPAPEEYWQFLRPLQQLGMGASGGVYASVYDSKL